MTIQKTLAQKINWLKVPLYFCLPLLLISFFEEPIGFSWLKLSLLVMAIINSILLAEELRYD